MSVGVGEWLLITVLDGDRRFCLCCFRRAPQLFSPALVLSFSAACQFSLSKPRRQMCCCVYRWNLSRAVITSLLSKIQIEYVHNCYKAIHLTRDWDRRSASADVTRERKTSRPDFPCCATKARRVKPTLFVRRPPLFYVFSFSVYIIDQGFCLNNALMTFAVGQQQQHRTVPNSGRLLIQRGVILRRRSFIYLAP